MAILINFSCRLITFYLQEYDSQQLDKFQVNSWIDGVHDWEVL